MRRFIRFTVATACLITFTVLGCGGTNQFELDVEGAMTQSDAGGPPSFQALDTRPQQVLIGVKIVEIKDRFEDRLGIQINDFSLGFMEMTDEDLQLILTPNIVSEGTLFKRDDQGIPFGQSTINFDVSVVAPSTIQLLETGTNVLLEDGLTLRLGGLQAVANTSNPNELPVISKIPLINYLFKNTQRQAEVESLLIILTPRIIQEVE